MRHLSDPRLFEFTDFIALDEGDQPLQRIITHLVTRAPAQQILQRTFIRHEKRVQYIDTRSPKGLPPSPSAPPQFSGLPLTRYFPMIESPNPMHRIWSCGRWTKFMLAHGCYWHRCAFCDTGLDYIGRYSAPPVPVVVDHLKSLITQTGSRLFHFIDEAMPPAMLRALSRELIRQRLNLTWWGNIRFDNAFTPDLTALMAKAGCIAVTGGLEAPTNRLLALLDKGFTLEQATRVLDSFSKAGIMTHAYLMYGCPSQTEQDTVDALEYVRQLFEAGLLQSAYWHRFALTVHSPIYKNRNHFGLTLCKRPRPSFACNEVPFRDSVKCDHDALGRGLRKALYNYMHSTGLDFALQDWFDIPVPHPQLPTDFILAHTKA